MTNSNAADFEAERLVLQEQLDAERDLKARNRMGQFATPTSLAINIQRYAAARLEISEKVRFIDPAIGTGSFFSAMLNALPQARIDAAVGYEIDSHYGIPARKLWRETKLEILVDDFTRAECPQREEEKFNLIVCNPPYVRHHHIGADEKQRLRRRVFNACGIDFSGLAGLYCHFLGLSHPWMRGGGLAGWLIPSEFMDVNYGVAVKRYLLRHVTLLHIHRFDPNEVQFNDALVSSAVVWFRKSPPTPNMQVRFSYGGSLECPQLERMVPIEQLGSAQKWTHIPSKPRRAKASATLGDFFKIKRGVATGGNRYFILTAEEIDRRGLPIEAFKPILPSPRHLRTDEVQSDKQGNPILEKRLFLLDPPWPEDQIQRSERELWAYLEEGKANGVARGYICRHRKPWYRQESRAPAVFVCTYLGRSDKAARRPFRFILNHSMAVAANVYLMLYPTSLIERMLREQPELNRQVWQALSEIKPSDMLSEGRVYGGGLHKLEPRELGKVPAEAIAELLPAARQAGHGKQCRIVFG